ncbi:MAG: hypothetical protein QM809_16425 [Gordonia sp. (in: high G+C Gram-positive bacteria)]|uniref:hypothetical protein n=1 Tax=Gordonia sp. (in: high G+C Gram-positive bacteria) TaxID=84139 RepID=UPI0039E492A7
MSSPPGSPRTAGPAPRHDAARTEDRVVLRVLIYSDDADTRRQVRQALGSRPHPELPEIECLDVATAPAVLRAFDRGGLDLVILDGEAAPAGGLGLAKQLRDEYSPCPPLLVLIARAADRWLADWSRANASAMLPVDPILLPRIAADLLRRGPSTPTR